MSRYPAGEDLKVGSTVKLCGLASAQGQRLNEKVGQITNDIRDERFAVKLVATGEKKLLKPQNLRIVCSFCHADSEDFYTCEDCMVARYCGVDFQKKDWKKQSDGHKQQCNIRRN